MFVPQDLFYGNTSDADGSPVVAADGTIYFLAEGHRLYAVSAAGNLKWFLPVPGEAEPDSSPALAPDGTIFVGSDSPYIYAVNPDGSIKSIFDMSAGEFFNSSPAMAEDETIYIAEFGSGDLFAIDPANGATNWMFSTGNSEAVSSPAIGEDGTIFIGTGVFTLDAVTNGSVEWAFTNGNEEAFISSPAIGKDGTVYAASEDGNLYALFGTTPLATNAIWPMFHGNPDHTGLQSPPATQAEDCGPPYAFVYNGTNDGVGNFTFSIVGTTNSVWSVYASTNLIEGFVLITTNAYTWTNTWSP
jgi:outer membrane protein assembly factor BamB